MIFNKKSEKPSKQSSDDSKHEETIEKFRQCLRDVDSLIKNRLFAKARARLAEARQLEPSNPYLAAFEERITHFESKTNPLKQTKIGSTESNGKEATIQLAQDSHFDPKKSEQKLRQEIEKEYKEKYTQELQQAERTAAQKVEYFEHNQNKSLQKLEDEFQRVIQTQIAEERRRIQAQAQAMIEAEKKDYQRKYDSLIADQNRVIKEVREELRKHMETTFLSRLEQISKEYDDKLEILGAKLPQTNEEKIAFYRENMLEYYLDGQPSVENAKRLMRMKELLELTFDEHFKLESDIRLELYINNVQRSILSGEINLKDKKKLEALRKRFSITKDQATSISSYIKSSFNKQNMKGRLLIVDDEEELVRLLKDTLEDNGFQVITALDVESAFRDLKNNAVDLILCDIKFPQGELDGFKFFSEVQEYPHLRKIPFIFMSALHDGVIMRSGFQLGVDDYITKPLDMDTLIAIINGKLKRYRGLKLI